MSNDKADATFHPEWKRPTRKERKRLKRAQKEHDKRMADPMTNQTPPPTPPPAHMDEH